MSDILEVIKTRRSVRKYKSDMVPAEIIDKIIEAGTYAATGMDRQSPIILAVTDKELRDKLSKMNSRIMGKSEDFDPFYGAPVVLLKLIIPKISSVSLSFDRYIDLSIHISVSCVSIVL